MSFERIPSSATRRRRRDPAADAFQAHHRPAAKMLGALAVFLGSAGCMVGLIYHRPPLLVLGLEIAALGLSLTARILERSRFSTVAVSATVISFIASLAIIVFA